MPAALDLSPDEMRERRNWQERERRAYRTLQQEREEQDTRARTIQRWLCWPAPREA